MSKKLSEMTLEELWQLFPIILTGHQSSWAGWYAEEALRLSAFLPAELPLRISHIGSTAVDSICAKPIIDILVEAPAECDFSELKEYFVAAGYLLMSQSGERLSFNRGYTEKGFAERVFHLHLRHDGDNDELYFRDYLKDHPDAAREYEGLKLSIWKRYEHDRDGYTAAKADFVTKHTEIARKIYGKRY